MSRPDGPILIASSPSPQSTPLLSSSRPPTAGRFVGDGMDFRRPISTNPNSGELDVIDLTQEDDPSTISSQTLHHTSNLPPSDIPSSEASRLPRFPRDIFNTENPDDGIYVVPQFGLRQSTPPYLPSNMGQRSSPDVEFVFERQRPLPPLPVPGIQQGPGFQEGGHSLWRRPFSYAYFPFFRHQDDLQGLHETGYRTSFNVENGPSRHQRRRGRPQNRPVHFPVSMDYNRPAFDLATGRRLPSSPPRSVITIEDLPPVREGFTRCPKPDDELICPRCDEELCANDGEVFVAMNCGHVYCGKCAKQVPKRRPTAKQRPPKDAFLECVVTDCGNDKLTGKGMVQLYL